MCAALAFWFLIASPIFAQSPPPAQTPAAVATPSAQASGAATTVEAEDIRDIRGPISISSPWRWLWVVGGVTALLGLLYSAWRWYRLFSAAKTKQPFEIALARLEKAKALMKPEQAREYSFAVSEITREYIETRFGERAARRTTQEFLHDLLGQADSPLAAHQPLLEDFLRHCDLAKFARWQLDVPQMESMHESARTFVMRDAGYEMRDERSRSRISHPASHIPHLASRTPHPASRP